MDISTLTISQVKKGLETKEFSADELLEVHIEQIKEKDPKIHAFVSTTFDRASNAIEDINDLSILYGVPASIKDNYNWKGTKTTACSNILKNYESVYDATVTARLLGAGACLLGKTNMDAFAHGSSTETSDFFPTFNPHNLDYLPGGSSGGSAAAVASGMSVYSIGSETAGSVRGPAAWCGIVGFAPTYGRFSRYGLIAMGSSLDRPGVLTRNVMDAAILTEVLSGHDPLDATSIDEPFMKLVSEIEKLKTKDLKGIRIGLPSTFMDDRIDSQVLSHVKEALKKLEKNGAVLVDIDLMDPKYSIAVYTVVCRSEVSSNLARIDGIRYGHFSQETFPTILEQIAHNRGEGFGNEAKQRSMTGAYTLSAGYYDAYYKKAQKLRTLIIEDFKKAFEQVDLIVGPTMPTTAPKVGATKNNPLFGELADELTEPSALAGLPCISIPVGKNDVGLPIGMQIIGKQKDELGVLKLARLAEIIL